MPYLSIVYRFVSEVKCKVQIGLTDYHTIYCIYRTDVNSKNSQWEKKFKSRTADILFTFEVDFPVSVGVEYVDNSLHEGVLLELW